MRFTRMPARISALLLLLSLALPPASSAQNLEPRLYLPLPTGRNIATLAYGHSSGEVLFDPAVPITDVVADVNAFHLAFVRGFGLLGRSAQVQAVTSYVDASLEGKVSGRDSSRTLLGFADPQLRFAVNLLGGPARTRSELATARFGTIVGASLTLSAPLGKYESERLINISANRWSVKPEVGLVQVVGGVWAFEGYAGVWLFGDNTEYRDSLTASQDPLWTFQGHVVRVFGRKLWFALDGTWVAGGTSKVDGVVSNNFQKSARIGATGSWAWKPNHILRAGYATGVYTRFGGDFTILSVGYAHLWGG